MGTQPGQAAASHGVEALYPFLYAGETDLDDVLAQVRRSTVAKAQEIVQLREQVLDRYGTQLVLCAQAMADSFAAGGRLLAFGNGGSSTDAQDVASTFLQADGGAAAAGAVACGRHRRGHRLVQRHRVRRGVRAAARGHGPARGHCPRAVDQRQLGKPGQRLRGGRPTRHGDRGNRRRPGREDGRSGHDRSPLRGPVGFGAPDPGGADHHLPRLVGVDTARPRQRAGARASK